MSNDPTESRTPAAHGQNTLASTRREIDEFLARARTVAPVSEGKGRLIFALDATLSRQPTWDAACQLQAEMFAEAAAVGGLEIQLLYYRGFGECRASAWVSRAENLAGLMNRIDCRGGHTQIRKVLAHARREAVAKKVRALVFIGDAMEEKLDDVAASAGELGLLGVPALMFHEGHDQTAERAFREIARLTRGAYCRFDAGAADTLRSLLRAAAAFAAGGMRALESRSKQDGGASLLLQQLK